MADRNWREVSLIAEDVMWLRGLKVGDSVMRLLGGVCRMDLRVTEIRPDRIVCQGWDFDPITGGELDEELGWDGYQSGSFIRRPTGRVGWQ